MATILTKKSDTASAVPLAADLTNAAGGAELAVNATDKRLFSKTSGGTVVELGTNPTAMAVVGNTTVGGTLGVTGATTLAGVSATTLSASSTVTLSGGTANGVAYLNGSKVVTSGSALTFNGTQLGIVNGAGSAILKLDGSSAPEIDFYSSGVIKSYIYAPSTSLQLNTVGANPIIFLPNEVEGMRLTSTGLGIGTSSILSKLVVSNGSSKNFEVQPGATTYLLAYDRAASDYLNLDISGKLITFSTNNGAEKMRLDSSGNLGLGVTPSAWGGTSKALQIKNYLALWQGTSGATQLGFGLYESSDNAYSYLTTGDAPTMYRQLSGIHSWYTAPSGTAGNAITFTQAMTLDASGNLGIGTTSPSYKLDVAGNIAARYANPDTSGIVVQATTGTNAAAMRFINTGGNAYVGLDNSAGSRIGNAAYSLNMWHEGAYPLCFGNNNTERARIDSSGNFLLGNSASNGVIGLRSAGTLYIGGGNSNTNEIILQTGSSERARIDSSGNLLVGTSTNRLGEKLHVLGNGIVTSSAENTNMGLFGTFGSSNLIIGAFSNLPVEFRQNNTERMRIDSSGNLLVGTTSSAGSFRFQVVNTNSSGNAVWLQNASGNDRAILVLKHDQAAGATSGAMVGFQNSAGTTVGTITSSNTATAYNTSSDYRLKNSVAPMTGALAKVAQLKPCTYKWKADGSDGEGFIAHELAEVVPQCVTGEKDAVDEEGNPKYQGIDTSFLVATLTAAIQELKAEFDAYKASHP